MSLTVWTVLWVSPDGKPFKYNTRPQERPKTPLDEARLYSASDVQKYQRMVERTIPGARFRCLSNIDIPGVDTVKLKDSDLIAWWAKCELWSTDTTHDDDNLYLDLDTLIVGKVTPIIEFDTKFAAILPGPGVGSADINNPRAPEPWPSWKDQEGKWRVPKYQTSVMFWKGDYVTKFWAKFQENKADYLDRLASDQDFLGEQFPDEDRLPTHWFKKISKHGTPPKPEVKVVMSMPMRNDKAAEQFAWVKKIWH